MISLLQKKPESEQQWFLWNFKISQCLNLLKIYSVLTFFNFYHKMVSTQKSGSTFLLQVLFLWQIWEEQLWCFFQQCFIMSVQLI
jgi:hypothetical protein